MFKIRASAAGSIMTNNRAGTGMGDTCKTYLETWYKSQVYGRNKEVYNKTMMKGTFQESTALQLLEPRFGMLLKNERHFESDYITGTPDVVGGDFVLDVKCSWDCFTFPYLDKEVKNKDYIYQLQCYMLLTGKKKGYLAYCLVDAPENLVMSEANKEAWLRGEDEVEMDLYNEIKARHIYSNLPTELTTKVFEIGYDSVVINAIQSRVLECRKYIADNFPPLPNSARLTIHESNYRIIETANL